jgi:hypothetical protein
MRPALAAILPAFKQVQLIRLPNIVGRAMTVRS